MKEKKDETKLKIVTLQEVKRKTALPCQKLTRGGITGASMLLFNLISILRPISNFLALFKLCDYNLILLTNVKLFEKHLSAHKTRCRWPDDRFWGLHDYITQRHTLTLLRHQSDSLLQRQRFVQKLLRETLWLDRQNWSSAERARCFLGVLRLYPPRHILLQMSSL